PNSFRGDEMEIIHNIVGDICYALEHFESEAQLHHLAFFDSLTKLANPSLFSERLAQVLNVSGERGEKVIVVLWDVEKLTDINNSFGRYVGDRVLQEIAQRVRKQSNLEPVTAHFGSGKFGCYIVTDEDQPDIATLVARREQVIFGKPFEIDGQVLHVSARGGATLYPRDAAESSELIQTAEAALNIAKSQKAHLVLYTAQIMSRASARISLESRLRRAIEEEQFLLHYQPKVRVSDGRILGVEALIRWHDPEVGMISPMQFIPVLEQSGMIVDVDRWVVRQALKDRERWREAGLEPPHVAVNVTSPELNRDDFVTWFLDQVGTSHPGSTGSGIDIEITESMLMLDIESSIRKLNELREAGMAISIDDFGTGYSSLSYLARLPVDILKIDRSFVKGIATDSDDLQIISTIVSLARSLDLITVAEGVETQEQFNLLRQMNCPVVQGYFFSKPLPDAELRPLLARGAFAVSGKK
ncbi:MAG TPA: bifunctional diguanylate cyclase/phosphodiesterase, partial [Gammaproteobacteria bacterium]|nr:bifunctional diguanylate cyclase/phosphodiesterase [Gammaproteobacteria bacterium]